MSEIIIFATSLLTGLVGIVLIRRFWTWRRGWDLGDGIRKLQSRPVLRVGGLALYFSFVVSFALANIPREGAAELLGLPFFLLATAMFLLGMIDDLLGLPAMPRLAVQVGIGVAAYFCGMRIDLITDPFGGGSIETHEFGLILTVVWFVAIPNLINLVDGMDGLAGGIALFLCLTLATIGGVTGNAELLNLNVALAGGIVAFLAFNLPPAKIYLGDGGAYLVGFLIAGSSLLSSNKGSVFGSLLVVVIALGFPILDTALAMVRRGISGLPVMRPDALHLHHRLQVLGFSKRNILFALYGIFACLALLGISVFLTAGYTLPVVGMVVTIGVIQGLRFLGLPHNLAEAKKSLIDVISARKDVRYSYTLSLVLEHELERTASADLFWDRLRDSIGRLGLQPGSLKLLDTTTGEGSPEPGGDLVVLRMDATTLWLIQCAPGEGRRKRWVRVARCFHPVIMGAKTKWGGELPESLGFVVFQTEAEVAELAGRINEALEKRESSPPVAALPAIATFPLV